MSSSFGPKRPRDDSGRSPAASGWRDATRGLAGLAPLSGYLGAGLSVLGLIIVAIISLDLLNGQLPTLPGGGGNNNPGASGGPNRTATPSNVVVVDPRTQVLGSIVYAKAGNIWIQTAGKATQLTTGGQNDQPTWAPDGSAIYFIRARPQRGRFINGGQLKSYDLQIQSLMRMNPDGSNPVSLLTGEYSPGSLLWSYFVTQPSISPDGKIAAIITDGPNPTKSDIVLKLLNLATGKLTNPLLPESGGLGHQDPAWSPDGAYIAYVRNAREGAKGAAQIVRYTVATKAIRVMTGPGYIEPAWSPDGRYLAVVKTGSAGTDIDIIDARNGGELLRLTNDGSSFDPVWSPAGDSIAFLKEVRGVIDLSVVKLVGSGPGWQVGDPLALTVSAGLDGESHPSWFIPPDQLPKPTPTPVPTIAPPGVGSPGPS
jgi:dipeptidyl aminopeptidase/acylaminoacyl peptidase